MRRERRWKSHMYTYKDERDSGHSNKGDRDKNGKDKKIRPI